MMLFPCDSCGNCVRVLGDPEEISSYLGEKSDFWPSKHVCPICGEKVLALDELYAEGLVDLTHKVRDLTPEDCYRAMIGEGLPEELHCTEAAIKELFKMPIKSVYGQDVPNTERFCMEALEFEDGTTLYLGASTHGAVVYRIKRPR